MASILFLEGQYKVASNIIGKKDLKDFKIKFPYPLTVDFDEDKEVHEALFYIKRFFLERALRDHDENFYGQYSCEIVDSKEMTDAELQGYLESGELKAIDPDALTAKDIKEFKPNDFIWAFIMMDGDNTPFVSQNISTFTSRNKQEKVSVLMEYLGIEESKEIKADNSKNRKKAILGDKSGDEPKHKRAPRKKATEMLEVSE